MILHINPFMALLVALYALGSVGYYAWLKLRGYPMPLMEAISAAVVLGVIAIAILGIMTLTWLAGKW